MLNRAVLLTMFTFSLCAMPVLAATDHSDMVKGPFKTGEDVTKGCLECHEQQATDFMKTTHWTWQGTPNHVQGMEKSGKTYGKFNMLNSFCTSVQGAPNGEALEACGMSIQAPRPKNPKSASPEEAAAFKKSLKTSSPRKPQNIPSGRSRCAQCGQMNEAIEF